MFKQQPIKYTYITNKNEFEPIEGTQTKPYIYGREIEITVLPWDDGYFLQIHVINNESTFLDGNYKKVIHRIDIYDSDFEDGDVYILSALYTGDIRGRFAEGIINTFFIKYGMDIIKEYFPLLYNQLNMEL